MSQHIYTKICGITSGEQAIKAAGTKAEFLGLILAEATVRSLPLKTAGSICRELRLHCRESSLTCPAIVGVFKDQPETFINRAASELDLDYVQLHGLESAQFCHQIKYPVIKAITFDSTPDLTGLSAYRQACRYLLFDRPKHAPPDTSWRDRALESLSNTRQRLGEFFFAGGLTVANVSETISKLSPFAVDVSSGVERAPGIKDERLMHEFVQAVHQTSSAPLNMHQQSYFNTFTA